MAASSRIAASKTGVCYGLEGDNLPTPDVVVALYNRNNIQRMRLYGPNTRALTALNRGGQEIELLLGVLNTKLEELAESIDNANSWIEEFIKPFDGVNIRYIAVGNAVSPWNPATAEFVNFLLPAMKNLHDALQNDPEVSSNIKVSTALDLGQGTGTGVLTYSIKPSECSFNVHDDNPTFIPDLLNKLLDWGSPLLVNIHPYNFIKSNSNNLNYALFSSVNPVVSDGNYDYHNLFDALLDSVHVALAKIKFSNFTIVVSETGWPTVGQNANNTNAETYNNKLIQHVKTNGTPRKPLKKPIEAYIYAMFDEDLRKRIGNEEMKHWGIFNVDGTPKYPIQFPTN